MNDSLFNFEIDRGKVYVSGVAVYVCGNFLC